MARGNGLTCLAILMVAAVGAAAHRNGKPRQQQTELKDHTGVTDTLDAISWERVRLVDMTYAIDDKLPKWPGDNRGFEATSVGTPQKDGYFSRSFWMLEHYGTHMDAPAHFPPGKDTLDRIPIERFFGRAVVIDVRRETLKDPDYRLTIARIQKWEAENGHIAPRSIALLRTGWASRWPDEAKYRNMDANGVMHFPGYGVEAARLLIARGVVGLGIDTLSVDYGPSRNFEVHRVDLPAKLFNLENVANLDDLPESGAFVIAVPIKLAGGSGGPVRVFGVLPR